MHQIDELKHAQAANVVNLISPKSRDARKPVWSFYKYIFLKPFLQINFLSFFSYYFF
jgi:hypothetical protein